jgi:hypothetical protein
MLLPAVGRTNAGAETNFRNAVRNLKARRPLASMSVKLSQHFCHRLDAVRPRQPFEAQNEIAARDVGPWRDFGDLLMRDVYRPTCG